MKKKEYLLITLNLLYINIGKLQGAPISINLITTGISVKCNRLELVN